jgi:ribulose 1,5-bisphosphate carboxylase large subunit-like protein
MIDNYIFKKEIDKESHIIADYYIESKDFTKAAKAIAIGQSIGNPDVRTQRDSPEMMENNLAKILNDPKYLSSRTSGKIRIAYPLINFGEGDGITQLLCTLMGGQMDIDLIESCRLEDVQFPQEYLSRFKGPKFGMQEIKRRTGAINRPLLGGIVKPKTGITVPQLKGLVRELLEGGVDFIKEDEILGNPNFCKFNERIPAISDLVKEYEKKQGREIFYAPCINGDYPYFIDRAKFAADHEGIRALHLNIWAGLPTYRALRDLDLDAAIFFQKSGDKVMTSKKNPYSIKWNVFNKLARMVGSDFIHAGMWGGYLSDTKEDLSEIMDSLRGKNQYAQTIPSLSCGSNPGLVDTTIKNYGNDLLMNVGGAIQGHPMGTTAGAIAMRQAFECNQKKEEIYEFMKNKPELKTAIEKWGYSK